MSRLWLQVWEPITVENSELILALGEESFYVNLSMYGWYRTTKFSKDSEGIYERLEILRTYDFRRRLFKLMNKYTLLYLMTHGIISHIS